MKRVLLSLLMTISLVFAGPMSSHAQTPAQAQTDAQAQQGYGTTTDDDSGHGGLWGLLGLLGLFALMRKNRADRSNLGTTTAR